MATSSAPNSVEQRNGRLRIAFVYPAYWPYVRRGVERLIHDLGAYLATRGHDVHVFCGKPGPARVEQSDGMTIHYFSLHYSPLAMAYLPWLYVYRFGLDTVTALMKGNFDVLHIFTYSFAFSAPLLQRFRHIPYVFHAVMDDPGMSGGFSKWMYERLLCQADQVATLTQRGADLISDRFGITPVVLPPPVNMEEFRPCAERDKAHPIVLFPGDLGDERKGGYLLLRAWNEIHRQRPEARLVLAGPYGLAWNSGIRAFLSAIPNIVLDPAARAAIEVRGTGTLADVPAMYASASVTVLPSINETFGMAVTESLACGTPVVCSDDAGPNEILAGNCAIGRTVPLHEAHDLWSARSVGPLMKAVLGALDLSQDPETTAACRKHAEQWSIPTVGARAEAIYDSVLRVAAR